MLMPMWWGSIAWDSSVAWDGCDVSAMCVLVHSAIVGPQGELWLQGMLDERVVNVVGRAHVLH